jgi:DNA-binding HxlR family transcriptional regulator
MALLDILGRRMTLRILWELVRHANPMTFRMLQEAAETNPSVLNTRLKELRAARLVLHDENGYVLSEEGKALLKLLLPLHKWAAEWAARSETASAAPSTLHSRRSTVR